MISLKRMKINMVFLGIILVSLSMSYLLADIDASDNNNALKPRPNNGDQFIQLHSYDFEDDVVGQDPTEVRLSVHDPVDSGSVYIDNLGDEQQNHVALLKSGGTKSIRLTNNLSYFGYEYGAGEIHFRFYHDDSLFGIHMRDSNLPGLNGILFAIDLWDGIVGRHGVTTYTSYPLNQWLNLTIYYDITLGWMFEIDGVRFGDGYSFSFAHENPSGLDHINWGSAYSGGGNGYLRLDDIAFYYDESRSSSLNDDTGNGVDMIIIIVSIAISIIMIFTVIIIVKKKLKRREIVSDEDIEILPSTDRIIKQEERVEVLYCPGCNSKLEPNISICSYCGCVIEDFLNDNEKSSTK